MDIIFLGGITHQQVIHIYKTLRETELFLFAYSYINISTISSTFAYLWAPNSF